MLRRQGYDLRAWVKMLFLCFFWQFEQAYCVLCSLSLNDVPRSFPRNVVGIFVSQKLHRAIGFEKYPGHL